MQSYETTFAPNDQQGKAQARSNIILSPDNDYLKQFRGPK
jgi:hypothetical protein